MSDPVTRRWATLFSHCPARLPKDTESFGPYYGRCDLRRGHDGPHVLERGMEEIEFSILPATADRERRVLQRALAHHEEWCGHNADAPGHSIVNEPYVARALRGALRP
jgi:hypothetical protein